MYGEMEAACGRVPARLAAVPPLLQQQAAHRLGRALDQAEHLLRLRAGGCEPRDARDRAHALQRGREVVALHDAHLGRG